jgi:hypothetical protein
MAIAITASQKKASRSMCDLFSIMFFFNIII